MRFLARHGPSPEASLDMAARSFHVRRWCADSVTGPPASVATTSDFVDSHPKRKRVTRFMKPPPKLQYAGKDGIPDSPRSRCGMMTSATNDICCLPIDIGGKIGQ